MKHTLQVSSTHLIIVFLQLLEFSLQQDVGSAVHDKAAESGTCPRTPRVCSEAGVWGYGSPSRT